MLTAREKLIIRKVLHVISEYHVDLDSDIEGCNGDELQDIESQMRCCFNLETRIVNYLLGRIDNARGVVNGEKVMTPLPKLKNY